MDISIEKEGFFEKENTTSINFNKKNRMDELHFSQMKNITSITENELLVSPNNYVNDKKYEKKNFKSRSWF
jgi:hypothetical protein